jgi:hypothetical protein
MSQEELDIQVGDIVAIHGEVLKVYPAPTGNVNVRHKVQVAIGSQQSVFTFNRDCIVSVVERKESPEAKAERLEQERDTALQVQQHLAQIIDDLHVRIDTLEAQIKNEREVFRRGPNFPTFGGGLVGWPVSPPVTAADEMKPNSVDVSDILFGRKPMPPFVWPAELSEDATVFKASDKPKWDGCSGARVVPDPAPDSAAPTPPFISANNFGVTPPEGYKVVLETSDNANSLNPNWTEVEPEAEKPWYPDQLEGYSEWREGPPSKYLTSRFQVISQAERGCKIFSPFKSSRPHPSDWQSAVAHCVKL